MNYRKLNKKEIEKLEKQGCRAESWESVLVSKDFSTSPIENVKFCGKIKIGRQNEIQNPNGKADKKAGIYNSVIADSIIDEDVLISNTGLIYNYKIGKNTRIENVNSIFAEKDSDYGVGRKISILNEAGGRELPLLPSMSSQIAYLFVHYRHDKKLQKGLDRLANIEGRIYNKKRGLIIGGAEISNVKEIRNVVISGSAVINNASCLVNGTILLEAGSQTYIGTDVYAKNFIVLSDSCIDTSAVIDNCFIGQSVKIGKQYSAENSAFFANCEFFHGEACSIFAGPYSVSHHKSSLLIAGYFSFYNAGSGTNQSNHMYKLGPVHQGIIERGSKTGSFSYLLFPSRVGPFSVVIGKHFNNFDASEFPFSYINEANGKSVLTPAMNLFSVGTNRDSEKWRRRDKRKGKIKLDQINFDIYSPFIVGRMIKASKILEKLYGNDSREIQLVSYKGLQIPRLLMKTCRKYYELGIDVAIGEQVIRKMDDQDGVSWEDILKVINDTNVEGKNEDWYDIGGQFISETELEKIKREIVKNECKSFNELNEKFADLHHSYQSFAWSWYVQLIKERLSVKKSVTKEDLNSIIENWSRSKLKLLKMTLNDAEKEFDQNSKIGFGIDGDEGIRNKDFENVRGTFDRNNFVVQVKEEIQATKLKFSRLN